MILWKQHFAPHDSARAQFAKVHVSWFNFVVHMLISPEQFDSALKLLKSPLWSMITENVVEEHFIFQIPDKCPVSQAHACKSSRKGEQDFLLGNKENEASDHNALVQVEEEHGLVSKKRRGKAALVETEVRRSDKIRKK